MRSFGFGVLVEASRTASGIDPASMPLIAERVASLGADALFLRSTTELAVEPVTVLAGLATTCDLVLGAVVPLATGRNPAIVAKLATTLALLAPGRCALIFEGGSGDALLEAVVVAGALMGDGPVRAGGSTYAVHDAFNEPRPRREDRPAVGALVTEPSAALAEASDIILARAPVGFRPGAVSDKVVRVVNEETVESGFTGPVVVEVSGGGIDHVTAVVARIAGLANPGR